MYPLQFVIALIFGLVIGSFLNVVIDRLPRMVFPELFTDHRPLNLCFPASHCPHCQKTLPWKYKIPIFSFWRLKGHCAFCQQSISRMYPSVELATAILFGLIVIFQPNWRVDLVMMFFVSLGLPLFVIDLQYQLLPDILSYLLLWTGLAVNAAFSVYTSPKSAIFGVIVGYVVFWIFSQGYFRLRKKEGLGLGDCKLLAALGAWFGWEVLPQLIFLASILGMLTMGFLVAYKKADFRQPFSFGPALLLSGLCFLLR